MRFEMKKLLFRKEVWIVLALSLIAILLLNSRNEWVSVRQMRIMREKEAACADMPLDEAEAFLEREYERFAENHPLVGTPEYDEEFVLRGMSESIKKYCEREAKMTQLVKKMYSDLDHAATDFERRDISRAIKLYNRRLPFRVCHVTYLNFALLNIEQDESMQDLFLLILCTLLAPLFAVEHETGMYQVLFASKKGKRGLFFKKLGGGLLCAAILAFCYTAILLTITWVKFGLSPRLVLAPVQIVPFYENCPYPISILTLSVLTACMRTLIGAFILALTAFASCCFRKTAAVFSVSVGVAAIPVLLSKAFENLPAGQMIMKHIGLIRLSHTGDYLRQYETVNVLGFPVSQMLLSIGCTCGLILCLLTAAYVIYTNQNQSRKSVKKC